MFIAPDDGVYNDQLQEIVATLVARMKTGSFIGFRANVTSCEDKDAIHVVIQGCQMHILLACCL